MTELRVGCGYDVHGFVAGRPLVLGGLPIAYTRGLGGHSDADVLTHALVDALLGAAGLGDIGDWFPSSDPAYRDADSQLFLDRVKRELDLRGWRVVNVDTTLLAQEPRLGGWRSAIRDLLAARLGLEPSRVSVKATTPDRLGALGRAEGIAAQAVVLLEAVEGVARR